MKSQASRRDEYERLVSELKFHVAARRKAGEDSETVARAVHAERRALSVKYKELSPEPIRTYIYERTAAVYGNPHGPTIEFLRGRGKSWDEIADSATRPGFLPELPAGSGA